LNTHSIQDEKIIYNSENHLELELFVPAQSDFFDGHFPQFKLLPGVAQFEIVTRMAQKYFNKGRLIKVIRRIKFAAPILPDSKICLIIDYNDSKNSFSFSIKDAVQEEKLYSSGSFAI